MKKAFFVCIAMLSFSTSTAELVYPDYNWVSYPRPLAKAWVAVTSFLDVKSYSEVYFMNRAYIGETFAYLVSLDDDENFPVMNCGVYKYLGISSNSYVFSLSKLAKNLEIDSIQYKLAKGAISDFNKNGKGIFWDLCGSPKDEAFISDTIFIPVNQSILQLYRPYEKFAVQFNNTANILFPSIQVEK